MIISATIGSRIPETQRTGIIWDIWITKIAIRTWGPQATYYVDLYPPPTQGIHAALRFVFKPIVNFAKGQI